MRKNKSHIILLLLIFVLGIGIYGCGKYIQKNKAIAASNNKIVANTSNVPAANVPENKSKEVMNTNSKTDTIQQSFINTSNNTNEDKPIYPKEIFLTFDDGPSTNNTIKILNILKENNVKATFFIVGSNAAAHPNVLKAISDSGMCIANHTYSHDYAIYKDKETFFQDGYKCNDTIYKILGTYPICYIRFPGGSDNTIGNKAVMEDIRNTLREKNIRYVDWNVSSGDAASAKVPMETIKSTLLTQLKHTNFAVLLMHDATVKTTSSEALPYVIKYLKDNGYVFRTFKDITPSEEQKMIHLKIIDR